ncbi:MAG: hypothetical protein QHC79_18910 [Pseudosphingobacterium sp.]|nr:hypothetical protein [Pseudosphingobacterium sp.]
MDNEKAGKRERDERKKTQTWTPEKSHHPKWLARGSADTDRTVGHSGQGKECGHADKRLVSQGSKGCRDKTESFQRGNSIPAYPVRHGQQPQPIDEIGAYQWACVTHGGSAQITGRGGETYGKDRQG